jgi:hypothetical protein
MLRDVPRASVRVALRARKQRVCGDHFLEGGSVAYFCRQAAKRVAILHTAESAVNPDGSLGEPNDVYTAGIEHKLSINGKPDVHAQLRGKRQGDRPPRR